MVTNKRTTPVDTAFTSGLGFGRNLHSGGIPGLWPDIVQLSPEGIATALEKVILSLWPPVMGTKRLLQHPALVMAL